MSDPVAGAGKSSECAERPSRLKGSTKTVMEEWNAIVTARADRLPKARKDVGMHRSIRCLGRRERWLT
jgi:hypothetical protein